LILKKTYHATMLIDIDHTTTKDSVLFPISLLIWQYLV